MSSEHIFLVLIQFSAFAFSIILHEVAHGYAAYRMGDPTAAYSNRLTLNPLAHVDLIGTIIVPLVLYTLNQPILGWAKPVPINPYHFRNLKRGVMITAVAGPATNFALAVVAGLLSRGFPVTSIFCQFLAFLAGANVLLGVFNLIPIPPLDGSRILYGLLPRGIDDKYMRIEPIGIFIVYGLLATNVLSYTLFPLCGLIITLLVGQRYM